MSKLEKIQADPKTWAGYEARTPVRAVQVESLASLPFPTGYGQHGGWMVELPGGSVPISQGDWLVAIDGSSPRVMSAQAFVALVGGASLPSADYKPALDRPFKAALVERDRPEHEDATTEELEEFRAAIDQAASMLVPHRPPPDAYNIGVDAAATHVSNRETAADEPWPAAKPKTGGIEGAAGASTIGASFGT